MSDRCIFDAVAVAFCYVLVILADMMILSATENSSYARNLFEIVSAIGNTGLSTGITAALSTTGKSVLIVTMFIGRVGVFSIAFAFLARPAKVLFRYPTEDVFVG